MTGGAGFIGSHVVDLLIEHGYSVAVVDNLSSGRRENVHPAARFYEMDIRDPALAEVFAAEQPDVVNHHAAQIDVRRSVAEPQFDADVNIRGSLNVLECARRNGVKKFIYISTGGAVYGEPQYLPCDEAHPIRPLCPYGASKYIFELYLHMYQILYGLAYVVLRYPNVYGPRQDPHGEAGVVAIFAGRMVSGQPVVINGDGEQARDFTYVGDCAQANLLVLEHPQASGIYNVGTGRPTTVNEVFTTLKTLTGYTGVAQHGPPKLGETRFIYLDSQRLRDELGWRPTVDLNEGLARTVEYFRVGERIA
ncbi:MAG: NAD-dependent epimerase/dehydratase family protein [Anaerolineales bacterium]|nr:NAD-dependent epimerase/dehydratase family protein [Anaerolineales bacterium]